MERAVTFFDKVTSINKYSSVMPRKYSPCNPHRTFKVEENWYTVSGSATVTDGLGHTYTLDAESELFCPVGSRLYIDIEKEWVVKQLVLENETAIINRCVNIQINWLIIETLLKALGEYEGFVSIPNETDILFKRAQTGDLYVADEYTNLVDQCIDNFVDRSGISRDVWLGKSRLKLQLDYSGDCKVEYNRHIDRVNASTARENGGHKIPVSLYNDLKINPLGFTENENHADSTETAQEAGHYTLEFLLTGLAATRRPKLDVTITKENGAPYVVAHRMPNDVKFGTRIGTIIDKLFMLSVTI